MNVASPGIHNSPGQTGEKGSVFCFGELLLRMSPLAGKQWIRKASMPVYIGGAELNVATALSNWKVPVRYCTALPDHYLSREILEELNNKGIDISAVQLGGNRIGTYYLAQGTDLKHNDVIYDRANSAFAELTPGKIDWESVLEGCTWFHFSAISPALGPNVAAVCREALYFASQKGIPISVDLNYRSKLWKYGKKPEQVMPELVNYCSVIMGNLWSVESLLGIASPIHESAGHSKETLIEAAGNSMVHLHQQYPAAQSFGYTFRMEKSYWGIMQHGEERAFSKEFSLGKTIDRVGSGDCFMAGLIYGLYNNLDPRETIDFASAAAVGKLKEKGDSTTQQIDDVKEIMHA